MRPSPLPRCSRLRRQPSCQLAQPVLAPPARGRAHPTPGATPCLGQTTQPRSPAACRLAPQTNTSYYVELGPQCLINPDDSGALDCMAQLMRSLITATAAASLISTFFIGYFGNLPLALAPGIGAATGLLDCISTRAAAFGARAAGWEACGTRARRRPMPSMPLASACLTMLPPLPPPLPLLPPCPGINAYVAYQVVGQFGDGELSYEQAMTAIFIEARCLPPFYASAWLLACPCRPSGPPAWLPCCTPSPSGQPALPPACPPARLPCPPVPRLDGKS